MQNNCVQQIVNKNYKIIFFGAIYLSIYIHILDIYTQIDTLQFLRLLGCIYTRIPFAVLDMSLFDCCPPKNTIVHYQW